MKRYRWAGILSLLLVMVLCMSLTVNAAATEPIVPVDGTENQENSETSPAAEDSSSTDKYYMPEEFVAICLITDNMTGLYYIMWRDDDPGIIKDYTYMYDTSDGYPVYDDEIKYTLVQSIEEGEALAKGTVYVTQEELDAFREKAKPYMQKVWYDEYTYEQKTNPAVAEEFRSNAIGVLAEFLSGLHKSGEAAPEDKPTQGDQTNQDTNTSDSNTSCSVFGEGVTLGSGATCVNKNGDVITSGLTLKKEEVYAETARTIYPLLEDIAEKEVPGFKVEMREIYIADSTNEQLTLKGTAEIEISYPSGYGKKDEFRVFHWNDGAQEWETVDFSKEDAGLKCTVTSLSPFGILYNKADYSENSPSGSSDAASASSGSGSAGTPASGGKPLTNVPQTGDAFPMAEVLVLALGVAVCALGYRERRKYV